MTYRELKEKLNLIDDSSLDREINAYDNYTGDCYEIACAKAYDDLEEDLKEQYAEDAGLVFIRLPFKIV